MPPAALSPAHAPRRPRSRVQPVEPSLGRRRPRGAGSPCRADAPTRWPYMPDVTEPTIRPSGPDRLLVVEQLRVVQQAELHQPPGRRARPRGRAAARRGRGSRPACPRRRRSRGRRRAGRPRGRCRGPSGGSPSRCGRRSSRGSRHGVRPNVAPGLDDPVEHVGRELGRDIELPAQLADIGDPARPDARVADLQLARGAEREGGVGQVLAGEQLQQLARAAAPSGRASAGRR